MNAGSEERLLRLTILSDNYWEAAKGSNKKKNLDCQVAAFLSLTVAGSWGKVHGTKLQLAIQKKQKTLGATQRPLPKLLPKNRQIPVARAARGLVPQPLRIQRALVHGRNDGKHQRCVLQGLSRNSDSEGKVII